MRNRGILCSIIIFSVCGLFQGDSVPFPPPCRCQQNGGVKQKFVVVAAMVGQQLPCALRRAMCPASGDDAVRRHFLAPCPFCAGPAFLSNPPTILNFSRGFLLIHRAAWAVCRSGLRNPAPGGCRWVKGFVATFRLAGCVRRLSPVGKTNMLFINNKVKDMFYKNNN